MVWRSAQIGTPVYAPVARYSPTHPVRPAFRAAPVKRYPVGGGRYLRKGQVYDMSDELEQFEEAANDAAIRPAHAKPRARALNAAFERRWRTRAMTFITGPR